MGLLGLTPLACRGIALMAICLAGASSLAAQGKPAPLPEGETLPFSEWLAAGERTEIPWKVRIHEPFLGPHQRLQVEVEVTLSGKVLARRGPNQDLFVAARLIGRDGAGHGGLRFHIEERLPKKTDLVFVLPAFVLPGKYHVGVILYDRITEQRSVVSRPLDVPPLRHDPLPESWSHLPAVQLLPPMEGLDLGYLPDVTQKLLLPIRTKRRVEIEIVARYARPSTLLPFVKLFSHLEVRNGSMNLTLLDLSRHKLLFQQKNLGELDWPRLKESLAPVGRNQISVQELQLAKENATFFRTNLERLLAPAQGATLAPTTVSMSGLAASSLPSGNGTAIDDPPAADPPLRVILLLSPPTEFPRGSKVRKVTLPEGWDARDSRVYYVRYYPGLISATSPSVFTRTLRVPTAMYYSVWDDLTTILGPLKPRIFDVDSTEDLRKALAAILADLASM